MNVLVVDVGGTHAKIFATGQQDHRQFASGPALTAKQIVSKVRKTARNWSYDVVSIVTFCIRRRALTRNIEEKCNPLSLSGPRAESRYFLRSTGRSRRDELRSILGNLIQEHRGLGSLGPLGETPFSKCKKITVALGTGRDGVVPFAVEGVGVQLDGGRAA